MPVQKIAIRVTAEGVEATKRAIRSIGRQVQKTTARVRTSMKRLTSGMSGMLTGAGIYMLVRGIGKLTDAYAEQIKAETKLQQTLRATGQYTAEGYDELREYASALQEITGVGDEVILTVESILGSFKLTTAEIKEITPIVLDMAHALETDLTSAAILLGKAAVGEVSTLKRYGIMVSEADYAARGMAAVLDELRKEVGGQAEAFGKTLPGQLKISQAAIGDVAETIGEVLTPAMVMAGKTAREGLEDPTIKEGLKGLATGLGVIIKLLTLSVEGWLKLFAAARKAGEAIGHALYKVIAGNAQAVGDFYASDIPVYVARMRDWALSHTTFLPSVKRVTDAADKEKDAVAALGSEIDALVQSMDDAGAATGALAETWAEKWAEMQAASRAFWAEEAQARMAWWDADKAQMLAWEEEWAIQQAAMRDFWERDAEARREWWDANVVAIADTTSQAQDAARQLAQSIDYMFQSAFARLMSGVRVDWKATMLYIYAEFLRTLYKMLFSKIVTSLLSSIFGGGGGGGGLFGLLGLGGGATPGAAAAAGTGAPVPLVPRVLLNVHIEAVEPELARVRLGEIVTDYQREQRDRRAEAPMRSERGYE